MVAYKYKGIIKQVAEGELTGYYYWELYNYMDCIVSEYNSTFEIACIRLTKAFIRHSEKGDSIHMEFDDNIYDEVINN